MLGIIFALLISIGIPILALIYACITKRFIPFFLGILAFTISQVLIRIPTLQYLEHSSDYLIFKTTETISHAILVGLSAGVFEEIARFILIYLLMKQRDRKSGFLFGAGHGGIEAILLVGINAFSILFSVTAHAYNLDFFIGGIERFFAILLHIGLSIIVLNAVVQKKFLYVILAILIHGVVNALAGILPLFMAQHVALITVEITLALTALAVFSYSLLIKRKERLR
ncbi:YhfC family glutamic-type intramembrane protease [Paraliobacillus sp. JSM ZJ581]|uniref:YhfC family glutamic-type intramembrane protease n=1 Tax=Paraliobacillus sp. JSM ZJ581 TaxID=3342118 RepID=UPI0035A847C0